MGFVGGGQARAPPATMLRRRPAVLEGHPRCAATHEHPAPWLRREHALAWKMAASPLVDRLICAPGNAGIAREAECVALDIGDHAAVIAYCRQNSIDLVVVGPEAPLCAGIIDDLEAAGTKTFGPSRAAARLEGSKGFTKDLCRTHGIPTATYERFRAAAP